MALHHRHIGRVLDCVRAWAGLIGLVGPVVAWGTTCPTYPDEYTMLPSWPTSRQVNGATPYAVVGLSCGASTSASASGLGPYSSYGAAYNAIVSRFNTTYGSGQTVTAGSVTVSGSYIDYCYKAMPANRGLAIRVSTINEACDPPEPEVTIPCDVLANQKHLGSANDQPDSFVPEDTICVKDGGSVDGAPVPVGGTTGCAAFKVSNQPWKRLGPTGSRDWLTVYQFTGLNCDSEPEQDETPMEPECETDITGSVSCVEDKSEKCHTNNGLTWCEGLDNKKNCGFANDKYTCLDSLQPDKCMAMPDGSRLCVEGAPTPPVPDNGTKGVKATPDGNMQTCTGANSCQQLNFYNTTTTSNSSRDPGQGSGSDGSGVVGPGGVPGGTGDGSEEGEESGASGGQACDAPPSCTGDAVQCAILEQQWRNRCVPLPEEGDLENVTGFTGAGPDDWIDNSGEPGSDLETITVPEAFGTGDVLGGGGSCPDDVSVSLSMGSIPIPLSQMCTLFVALGYLVVASATLLAVKITMGVK